MKNSFRMAIAGFGLVVLLGCNLVSGPVVPDPVLVELCVAQCERWNECNEPETLDLDCGVSFRQECEEDNSGRHCAGGEERIDECLASIAVEPCKDFLRNLTTEECDDLCDQQ